jgi:hypothetical protein
MSITTLRPRVTARLAVLYVVAALAAAAAAILLSQAGSGSPQVASAATHCTRFAPTISQDFNCFTTGTMTSGGYYATPSVALRDYNEIGLNASRQWDLSYVGGNGTSAGGTGTSGVMFSSGGYAQARCMILGSAVTGYCATGWHD